MEWRWAMRTATQTIEADNCISPHYFSTSCQHIKHSNTHNTHTLRANATRLRSNGGGREQNRDAQTRRTDAVNKWEDGGEATLKITCCASPSVRPEPTTLAAFICVFLIHLFLSKSCRLLLLYRLYRLKSCSFLDAGTSAGAAGV